MRPKFVEEVFALGDRQPRDVAELTAAEEQRLAPGFRVAPGEVKVVKGA